EPLLQLRGTLCAKSFIVALAALAATASFAQSSVTLSGLVDTAYVDTNNKPGTDDTKGLTANGSATTVLTLAGSEDLGGGLKANFQLQLTPDFINGAGVEGTTSATTARGNPLAYKTSTIGTGQQAFVGLSGNFGTVKLGRVNTASLEAWLAGSAFGTAIGSGYGSAGNIYTRYSGTATATSESAPTRFNGAVRYESPVFSGFSASLMTVPKANPTSGETVNEIAAKYSNGPLNIVLASMEVKASGTAATTSFLTGGLTANAKNKLNTLAANYTMGAATLMGAYWTEKQGTTVDANGYMIGGKYAMGATTLIASMGKNNDKTTKNVDKKIYGIGADYALSKRTALYARFDVRDANSVSADDDKTKRTAIGVRHTF
ncbi:porin, partial [Candidatus Dojkabacteria bacterium]